MFPASANGLSYTTCVACVVIAIDRVLCLMSRAKGNQASWIPPTLLQVRMMAVSKGVSFGRQRAG